MKSFSLSCLFLVLTLVGCKKTVPVDEYSKLYKEATHKFPNTVTKKEHATGLELNIPFHYNIENVTAQFKEELRTNITPSEIFKLESNLTNFNGFGGRVYLIENSQADVVSMDKILKKYSSQIKHIVYQDAESIIFYDRYMVYTTVFFHYIEKERVHIIFESTNVSQGNSVYIDEKGDSPLLSQAMYDLQVAKTLVEERPKIKLDTVSWKTFKNNLTGKQRQAYKDVASQIIKVADTIALNTADESPYGEILPYVGIIKVQDKSPLLTIFNTTSSEKEITRLLSKEIEAIDHYTTREYKVLLLNRDKNALVLALEPIYLTAQSDYVHVSINLYTNKKGEQFLLYVFPEDEAMAYFYSKFLATIKNTSEEV
ncbi:hypothetical protein SAMN05421766_103686 [Zobellia uliginosa]|uniref:Uncharacterized protein n=1 Tax=Zobellia uliginosa TaxID=143224 RepID=A0ABY1KT06_9FLAO|nr:hypothetical protein [Zobellia uliginosa]SIS73262.1 hypothetical protein SAMN05421766_103686 [Zobellia uliginosa]